MEIATITNKTISTFATDVAEGLTSFPEFLKSKYFYDQKGDVLFQNNGPPRILSYQ